MGRGGGAGGRECAWVCRRAGCAEPAGSVPGCAGVLAVLSLRGWSPAIPFLMAAPGPRRDALYAGASGTGDLRKCIAHHSQDREEDRTLINMSSHIASTLSPTPGGWTDVFHVFMT